jgi:uncharacterized protein YjbJ (UPF0337 family)
MGYDDKIENKGQELIGEAKQATGKVTGDERLRDEGRRDEAAGKLKQAGEHVKDAAKGVKETFDK